MLQEEGLYDVGRIERRRTELKCLLQFAFLWAADPANSVEVLPTGGVLVILASGATGVISLMAWFVKRQVAVSETALESLKKAVDSMSEAVATLAKVDVQQRKLVRQTRRQSVTEHRQVMAMLSEIKGVIVRAGKVVVTGSKSGEERV